MNTAELILERCRELRWQLVTCESVTGGLVCAALTEVPGSSDVVAGGLVTYAAELKQRWAHVEQECLDAGLVTEGTARAMAEGARASAGVPLAISVTGAAGPQPHSGAPVGTIWCAIAGPWGTFAESWTLTGDRRQIRMRATDAALRNLWSYVNDLRVSLTEWKWIDSEGC